MELAPLPGDKKGIDSQYQEILFYRNINLPIELKRTIVAKMMGVGRQEEEKCMIPLLLRHKFCNEIFQLQPYCPLTLGNKKLTAFNLWRMPEKKRLKLIDIKKPSLFRDTNIFSEEEQREVIDILPEDIQENLSIDVLTISPCYNRLCSAFGGVLLFGAGLMIGILDATTPPSSATAKTFSCILCISSPVVSFAIRKYCFTDTGRKVEYY